MKWRDRVQEYVRERGERSLRNLEQARKSECQDRDGSSSAVAIPWWEILGAGVEIYCFELNERYGEARQG